MEKVIFVIVIRMNIIFYGDLAKIYYVLLSACVSRRSYQSMVENIHFHKDNSTEPVQKQAVSSLFQLVFKCDNKNECWSMIITIDQIPMQSTFTSTNLHQTIQQPLPVTYASNQPSVTPRAGPVLPPQTDQYVPPLQFNSQQGLAFQSAYTHRPLSTNEPLPPRDPQISQSLIVTRPGSSKYGNKYSFKRNSTARAKNQSIRNTNDAVQAVAIQESVLGSIRSLAATRRGQIESASSTKEGVMLWNTLTEMYNLTLVGNSSQLSPLQPITLNQQNRPQFPNEQQMAFNRPLRPTQFLQSNQGQERGRVGVAVQPATSRSQNPTKEEFFSTDFANLSLSNSNQLYTRQIRELRGKIETLEHERSGLLQHIQRMQSYEQEMEHYRSEINSLRNQMGQLQTYSHQNSQVTELRENLRRYEEQLIQAHNHIEYLEKSRNEQAQTMQAQVRALQKIVNEHTASVVNRQKGEEELLRELDYTKSEHQNAIQILNQYSEENAYLKAEIGRLSNGHNQLPASDLQRQLHTVKEENSRLHIEVSTLRDDLNTARAQAEIYLARAATADDEYNDMECRYRQTVESLSSRYDELLDERNVLTNKLSESHEASPPGNEEAEALRASLAKLSAQVAESQQHLRTAEAYIEENMQKWEQAATLKEQHAQQQAFLATIHADLEATRRQNLQLAQRIQEYEHAVAEAERLRHENEKLTIIIRQKDNTPVSTSLKQIDEVQAALDNYVILHRQSEARVKELELYLAKAENFIVEQEGKMGESIQNFEKENSELKEQLSTAEDYIHSLQQASEEERRLLVQAVQGRRAEKKRADELLQHLAKAEDYIAGMQHRN